MPAAIFILLHWKKQQKVFLQNFIKVTKEHESKAIHDLRVAVKKLRSYLKLLRVLLKKMEDEPGFEETGQLFQVLGKCRDIEIALLVLQAFEKENEISYTAFRFHLKVALQQTGVWVQNALRKYDETELTGLTRQLEQHLKETDRQELLKKTSIILTKEYKKLKRLAKHLASQPHEVRKMLKNLFYWISICPKGFLLNSSQLNKLKKSLDLLGDWQDHEMLYRKIKHFRKDFVPVSGEEYLQLKELEKNIHGKMDVLLHKAGENVEQALSGNLNDSIR